MKTVIAFTIFIMMSCKQKPAAESFVAETKTDSIAEKDLVEKTAYHQQGDIINTGNTTPEQLLTYAKTLIGTPYKYGSIDPHIGFDCSGFITHVFNHFNITVPRSSNDFTHLEYEIKMEEAKPGDIVLFTGTNATRREVGHMGIITENNRGEITFIHSSSGKANGVTVTPLAKQYVERFVKVIRVFKDNYTK